MDLIVVQVVELLLLAERLRVVSRLAARDKDRDLKEQVPAARVVLGVDAVEDSISTTSSNGYQQFPSLKLRSARQSSFPVRRELIPLA